MRKKLFCKVHEPKRYLQKVSKVAMQFDKISSNANILGGKPCVKGSRISVELILEWMASGATISAIHQQYPHLAEDAIAQAVQYANS